MTRAAPHLITTQLKVSPVYAARSLNKLAEAAHSWGVTPNGYKVWCATLPVRTHNQILVRRNFGAVQDYNAGHAIPFGVSELD